MSTREARELLPAFQSATLFAAAGSDRSERILGEPDPGTPVNPICVRCDVGNYYAGAYKEPSPWCQEYGHDVFGQAPSDRGAWDRAEQRYRDHSEALDKVTRLPRRDA